jgi:ATP-dependent Clp protease adaptor protein ClpS
MSTSGDDDAGVAVQPARPKLAEPSKYAVVLHNDDFTTMEFVVEVLQRFFAKTHEQAVQVTLRVHHEGRGVAGLYSHQIAETKAMQVNEYSRSNGHPLKATAEPA